MPGSQSIERPRRETILTDPQAIRELKQVGAAFMHGSRRVRAALLETYCQQSAGEPAQPSQRRGV